MGLNESSDTLSKVRTLLQRAYELADYARSKFDSAPLPIGNYPGHVEHDRQFLADRKELMNNIRNTLESDWDPLEYQRFISRLERRTPSIAPGANPVRGRSQRCRCWWDARDEFLETADYLEELMSTMESQHTPEKQSASPWLSGSFYLTVFVVVVTVILVVAKTLPVAVLPLVLVAGILCLTVIGAFQLRQDEKLSQRSFLELMALTFRYLPWLKKQDTKQERE